MRNAAQPRPYGRFEMTSSFRDDGGFAGLPAPGESGVETKRLSPIGTGDVIGHRFRTRMHVHLLINLNSAVGLGAAI